jgi:tripartite-type tricarboxylate transporter receptor subunit TctC
MLLASASALGKEPSRPECIAPTKPGGGFDLTCKLAQAGLKDHKLLDAPMRVTYMPGGIGAAIWGSTEYHEHTSRPYGEPVDLAARFAPYEKGPPLVRAMLIAHTGRMLENLMQDVRLLGS